VQKNPVLYVDQRENIKAMLSYLNPVCKNMDIGDYLFVLDEKDVLVIERKTISDWLASIKDGRYHEQKIRLCSKYSKKQILFVLEGAMPQDYTLWSSLLNTMFRDEFHVFHTVDADSTVMLIENLFKKFSKQNTDWLVPKEIDYTTVMVEQIVPKKGKNQTADKVFITMLSCIPGISIKIATELAKTYKSMNEFCKKINSFEETKDREKWISSIEIPGVSGKSKKLGKSGLKILEYMG
jgi:crossover junction endonuclease MUS81